MKFNHYVESTVFNETALQKFETRISKSGTNPKKEIQNDTPISVPSI